MTNKKGMPVWGWFLIGCGGLALLAAVGLAVSVFIIGKKVSDFAEEHKDNPGLATAKLIDLANPDIELIDHDEDTFTFKEVKSGKTVTVNVKDLEKGEIVFETEKGKTVINAKGEDGEGSFSISSEGDGTSASWGTDVEGPSWIVFPSSAEVKGGFKMEGKEKGGTITATSPDAFDDLVSYYRNHLEDEGYTIQESTFTSEGVRTVLLNGTNSDLNRTFAVSMAKGDPNQIQVTYAEKAQ